MRKPIIAGNWKMNKTLAEAVEFVNVLKEKAGSVTEREIVVCPVLNALVSVSEVIKGTSIKLGAQNVYWEDSGAFTGEVSVSMLKDSGCEFVIIGHSERRLYFHETDRTVNKKIKKSLEAGGLTPIVCVGERLEERENNTTFKVVETQVKEGLIGLKPDDIKKLVIAYEPVWAIGTGRTATPEQAEEVHAFIRKTLSGIAGEDVSNGIRILYGGSIKPENISGLMKCENIDGGLVGGAALEVDSFIKLINYE